MELSRRLAAVAALVTEGCSMADIGTDHAYIPIWLVKNGRVPRAVAADVNPGPLERARAHVEARGMGDRISLRLSDGFSAFTPGEVQSAVLAGMGGALTIRILREGADVAGSLEECILQPQSEIEKVRAFLLQEGFSFLREDMVEEDGKYYPMMKLRPPSGRREAITWSPAELRYGKLLLESRNETLRRYLLREIRIRQEVLEKIGQSGSGRGAARAEEIRQELAYAEEGMGYYDS